MGSGAGAGSLGLAPGLAIGTGPGKVLPSAPSAPLTFKDGTALALSCMADYGGPVFPFLAVGGYKGKPGGPGGGQRGGRIGQGQWWEGIVMGSCCLGVAGPSRGWAFPCLLRSSGLCLGSQIWPLTKRGRSGGGVRP